MKTPIELIEYLHTKPHHVRERVAHEATLSVFGLIFFVWLGYQRAHLAIYEEKETTLAENTRAELSYIASPFAALKDSFANIWGSGR